MTRRAGRRADPGSNDLAWGLLSGVLILGVLAVLAAWGIGRWLHPPVPANPAAWIVGLMQGAQDWSVTASVVLAGAVLALLLVGGTLSVTVRAVRGSSRDRTRVDVLARSMSTAADQRELEVGRGRQLAVSSVCGPAVPIGDSVLTGRALGGSWEWTQLWIMGTRAGKTTCVCVPQIVSTRGPVLATSNKRDVVDLTRGPRSEIGQVWVHDPQGLVAEDPTWWWSPLLYATSTERADEVVSLFAAASRDEQAKTDAYFDTEAQSLLSSLLLAAAHDGRDMTDVYEWVLFPDDQTPEEILRRRGFDRPADAVRAARDLHPKQRDGVYGSARPLLSWMRTDKVVPWITPGAGRRRFDPAAFVRSRGTVYLLSMEGAGSARALTATLTAAVARAAEEYAIEQGGRLHEPLLCVLDEAANVCRWPELPSLYSHYGSRGIVLNTILQSWSQGVEVWGSGGMKKLWSAANVRAVGRGLGEEEFARAVSSLIGDHDVRSRSASEGTRGHRSVQVSNRREKILDVADVAALPGGRAVVLASGIPPVLVRLRHWSSLARPVAEAVQASKDHYGTTTALQKQSGR